MPSNQLIQSHDQLPKIIRASDNGDHLIQFRARHCSKEFACRVRTQAVYCAGSFHILKALIYTFGSKIGAIDHFFP